MRRRGQYLPRVGEREWVVRTRTKEVLVRWHAREGARCIATRTAVWPPPAWTFTHWPDGTNMPIRKRVVDPMTLAAPAAPHATSYLVLSPLLIEFASATSYEDGTARVPGYFTVRVRGTEWECTLYDPDAGARLPVRAPTVDDMMVAVELALGAQEAPWEQDRYLMEQLAKRPKKKPIDMKKRAG